MVRYTTNGESIQSFECSSFDNIWSSTYRLCPPYFIPSICLSTSGDCTLAQTGYATSVNCRGWMSPHASSNCLGMVKEMWLMCLDPQVCSSLSDYAHSNCEVLWKEAEEHHDAHHSAILSHSCSFLAYLPYHCMPAWRPITTWRTTHTDAPTADIHCLQRNSLAKHGIYTTTSQFLVLLHEYSHSRRFNPQKLASAK